MKRKAYSKFLEWKNKPVRKPLLVTGMRQCGKTFLIKEFGATEFENCAYFTFDGNDAIKSVFDYDFNINRIIEELSTVILGEKIEAGKTLVVFDEIQECPRAIQSLKYFCEDMPSLHVIAAGSLLGIALKKEGFSFPVGKVERLELFPMNFEEFVIADGGEKFINGIKNFDLNREIPELYKTPFEKYLKNFYITGGMPEVVLTWIQTHDYEKVDEVQSRILRDYADDFSKHADAETTIKIRQIWSSVPVQIAKENNKFVFSHVKEGARAKDLENALEWLVNAGLVYKVNLVQTPQIPLESMKDDTYFKVYMADVGLLRQKANVNYRTVLNEDGAYIQFKGAFTENYVLSELKSEGIPCYFWRTKADAEVDFLSDYKGTLFPIEVKSADNTKAKSLHLFCSRYSPKLAFKTSLKNVGDNRDGETKVWSLPLYVLFRLREYVGEQNFNWSS